MQFSDYEFSLITGINCGRHYNLSTAKNVQSYRLKDTYFKDKDKINNSNLQDYFCVFQLILCIQCYSRSW